MGEGRRVVATDLEHQIRLSPGGVELIAAELRDGFQPVGTLLLRPDHLEDAGTESAGDGEVRGNPYHLRFQASQRGLTGTQTSRVLGPQSEQTTETVAVDLLAEAESHEVEVRLRGRGDAGLVDVIESDDGIRQPHLDVRHSSDITSGAAGRGGRPLTGGAGGQGRPAGSDGQSGEKSPSGDRGHLRNYLPVLVGRRS